MNSKNNRTNHDFQIAYFLAGSCHTPDGAYSLLCDLHESRNDALKHLEAISLREQAKIIRAKRRLQSEDVAEILEAQADLAEIEASKETSQRCIDAAYAELKTIERCMALLEPQRKFAHLSLPEAHEAAQHDEWKLELIHRAENQLLTTGTIDAEHLNTMRMHPVFKTELLPQIEAMGDMLTAQGGREMLLDRIANKAFDTQFLLK
jgi:hypothetical protein